MAGFSWFVLAHFCEKMDGMGWGVFDGDVGGRDSVGF